MERLDKVLSNLGYGSRKEIKTITRKGLVKIDGKVEKDSSIQIDPEKVLIEVNGEKVSYRKYIYLMMNKPDGVVSATFDNYDSTVIDLLSPDHAIFEPFPVGRLDKDTVGLLLITNDGEMNHRLISPKYHVDKVYYAEIDSEVNQEDVEAFTQGIILDDGYKCMEAKLNILSSREGFSEIELTIQEGKFHQVKRMFKSRGKTVTFLKRIKFGPLGLDESLQQGEVRELSEEEVELLKKI